MNQYREGLAKVARDFDEGLRKVAVWPGVCDPPCGIVIRGRSAYEYRKKTEITFWGYDSLAFRNRIGDEVHFETGEYHLCGRVKAVVDRTVTFEIIRGEPRRCAESFCGHVELDHWAEMRERPGKIDFPVHICASCGPQQREHLWKPRRTRCHAPGCLGHLTAAGVCSACEAPRGVA